MQLAVTIHEVGYNDRCLQFNGTLYKLGQTRIAFSWTNPVKPSAPRDDWLSCEATQGKMQGKIWHALCIAENKRTAKNEDDSGAIWRSDRRR